MGAGIGASDNDPFALRDRVQGGQLCVWEVGLNLSQHHANASTPYFSAVILAVLGEAACCRVQVSSIECLIELFGDAPIGLRSVQGSSPMAWGRLLSKNNVHRVLSHDGLDRSKS